MIYISKGTNQKLKLFYLLRILYEKSNENNRLTSTQLITELERYGVSAERKSIYADLEALRSLGYDVSYQEDNVRGNYLGERYFQLSEVKMLIDVIQAANFISGKKSMELIDKLSRFVSEYDRKALRRQIVLADRVKSSNESVYYSIDNIYRAIEEKKRVKFKYFTLDVRKEKLYRNNGAFYRVNPLALMWDDEKYYLVAYDGASGILKNYRVDKMEGVSVCEESISEPASAIEFNAADCSKQTFSMFSGTLRNITLNVRQEASGIIFDRFGKDVFTVPLSDGTFNVSVDVEVSPQFYSWVFGVSDLLTISSPADVAEEFASMCEAAAARHRKK